jgi:EpsI family protein
VTKNNQNYRSVIIAAVTAFFLVLAYGLTYHALAARLAPPVSTALIAPEALEEFPSHIGDWVGEDIPMDEAIIQATGTDAHLSRQYSRKNGLEAVSVFVGCGAGAYERVIHRPEICYARAGWTLMSQTALELALNDGTKLPCSLFQFQRGGLRVERETALHYYVVDGQCSDNLTPLQSKLWRLGASANYIARVLIVAPSNTSPDSATRTVSAFAVDSADAVARLFDDLEKSRDANADRKPVEGN